MQKKYDEMNKAELIERLKELEKTNDDFSFLMNEDDKNKAADSTGIIKEENLELNRINKELEKLSDDYSTLFDFAPFIYIVLNEKGVIVNANLEASNLFRFPKYNLINLPFSSFVHPDFKTDFLQQLNEAKRKKEKTINELLLLIESKSIFCQITLVPYVPDGEIATFFRVTINDISSKYGFELTARSKDEEFSAIFNQFIAGLVIYDLNGRIKDVNKKYCEIVGRKKSELLNLSINDITHPDDISKTIEELKNITPENPQRFFEKRYLRPNKEVVWVNKGIVLIKGKAGKYNMIVGTIEDITARKAAEEALRESEARFRLMADTTPAFIWMTDANGKITYMNKTRLEFSGNTLDENLNSNWKDSIHPDDLPLLLRIQKENVNKSKLQFEFRLKSHEGKYRWIYDTAIPRYTAEGKFTGYIGSGIDISDIKEAEEKLKKAYQREKELRLETEKGKGKLSFLAEATSILNSSLEYNITLKTLAYIITPQLADWCSIDLLSDGNLNRVVVSHVDPAKVNLAHEIGDKYGPDPSGSSGIWNVIRTGKSKLYKIITEEQLKATTQNEEHLKITMELGLESAMIVPLKLRDQVFGAMTLVYAGSGRYYDEEDLQFIEDLAIRAALAVDNARLFKEASQLNYNLERQIEQLHHEMNEKKRTRALLEESEEKFRQLAENINSVFYIFNPHSKKIEYLSPAFKTIWGMEPDEFYLDSDQLYKFIHPEDIEQVSAVESTSPIPELEYRIIRPDKKVRWIYTKSFPLKDDKGEIYRIVGLSEDITQRKNTEEQIKNSLKEKELLLREIHHRVKNNLQIISSLLSLQSSYIKDQQTLEIFRDSQNRVKSMALVHEKLYQMKDLAGIDLPEYINDLTQMLRNTYRRQAGAINFHLDIDKIVLNIDMAIGLGLIINELISNVYKHAFPNQMKGEVYVAVKTEKNNSLTVRVEDNGVGFPENINFYNTESLGLQLVNTLVEQHWGKIKLQNKNGAHFKITFPELKYR